MSNEFEVIQDFGYGLIPRNIMRDKNISLQAKAIFSYLASFAGNKESAYPSVELMMNELNMSSGTFYKYLKELREHGIVEVKKIRGENGTFGKNIYYLRPHAKKPHMVNEEVAEITEEAPPIKKPHMDKPHVEQPHVVNQDTNSNSLNSNSINNNNNKDIDIEIKGKGNKGFEQIIKDYTNNQDLGEALVGYVEMRLKKKGAFTERALKLNINNLSKLTDNDDEKIAIVDETTIKEWKDFYGLKNKEPTKATNNNGGDDYEWYGSIV